MQIKDKLVVPDPRLMQLREGRLLATKYNPLLFAHYYLLHHITDPDTGEQSLSDFHSFVIDYAMQWTDKADKPTKECFIAPRNAGKTSWFFTILPIWAAAHGHQKFIVAFSDSASQAEEHLQDFKRECETNERLRADFPDLVKPKHGLYRERVETYNKQSAIMQNGFIFMARGADTSSLGMKVGTLRPSLIILDDIEKGESNYGDAGVKARLKTIQNEIFPMNIKANVVIVGTTTRMGSIIDQIREVSESRKAFAGNDDEFFEQLSPQYRWVVDEEIKCNYFPAITNINTPEERSMWPEFWSWDWIEKNRHTRNFALNYMCKPISEDQPYWTDNDIEIEQWSEYGNTIISVDPAVTTKRTSDYTGIAVLSRGTDKNRRKVTVRHAEQVKLSGEQLAEHVSKLVTEFAAKAVIVETNQGGALWNQVFKSVPARFRYYHSTIRKEIRAGKALDWYQKDRVVHAKYLPEAERQMTNFPNVANDDIVDAISAGVNYFFGSQRVPVSASIIKYR